MQQVQPLKSVADLGGVNGAIASSLHAITKNLRKHM